MNPTSSNNSTSATKKDTSIPIEIDEERPLWCTSKEEWILLGSLFALLSLCILLLSLWGVGIFDKGIKPTIEPITDQPSSTDIPTTTPAPIIVDIPTFNTLIEKEKTAFLTCTNPTTDSIDIVTANWTAVASPINCTFNVLQSVSSQCIKQSITPKEGLTKEQGCQLWPSDSWLREAWNDTCIQTYKNSSWTLQVVHRCLTFDDLKNKNLYLSKAISRQKSMILDCGPYFVDVNFADRKSVV